jgi:hypothetical protein
MTQQHAMQQSSLLYGGHTQKQGNLQNVPETRYSLHPKQDYSKLSMKLGIWCQNLLDKLQFNVGEISLDNCFVSKMKSVS